MEALNKDAEDKNIRIKGITPMDKENSKLKIIEEEFDTQENQAQNILSQ